jgi:hypothetical protein
MKDWESGMAERRAGRTRKDFRRKYGRSLGTSRKPIHPYGKAPSGRRVAGKRQRLARVSRGMQEEWGAGVSQWVARREIERLNLYFRRKTGLIKGHSTDEWKEGIGEWQDRALMSKTLKWLRRPGKSVYRSKANKRFIATVRESVGNGILRKHEPRKSSQVRQKTSDDSTTETSGKKIPTAESGEATDEIQVYVHKDGRQSGPYAIGQLQELVNQRQFMAEDLAFYQGLEQWVKIAQVPGLRVSVEKSLEVPVEEADEASSVTFEEIPEEESGKAESIGDSFVDEPELGSVETKRKHSLPGFFLRIVLPFCLVPLLVLCICDLLNQSMGWNIPIGLNLVGIQLNPKEEGRSSPQPSEAKSGVADGIRDVVKMPAFLRQGLVAYYPFDGNANDMSGNGNHGTVNGATLATDRHGNSFKAYSFDGSNDRIALPNSNDLKLQKISMAMWIKFSDVLGGQIISNESNVADGFAIDNTSDKKIGFKIMKGSVIKPLGGIYDHTFTATDSFSQNSWVFLAATYEGSIKHIYLDGFLSKSENSNITISYRNTPIQIGCAGFRNSYFKGFIDDLRIYDRALSAAEVATLYNHEKPVGAKAVVVSDTVSVPKVGVDRDVLVRSEPKGGAGSVAGIDFVPPVRPEPTGESIVLVLDAPNAARILPEQRIVEINVDGFRRLPYNFRPDEEKRIRDLVAYLEKGGEGLRVDVRVDGDRITSLDFTIPSTPKPSPSPREEINDSSKRTDIATGTAAALAAGVLPVNNTAIETGELNIMIYIDETGSMLSASKVLAQVRDGLLKKELLPYYLNNEKLYNSRVKVYGTKDLGTPAIMEDGERSLEFFAFAAKEQHVLAIAFQDEAAPAYHLPTFNKEPQTKYLNDLAQLRQNLNQHIGVYRGVMCQMDRGKTYAKSFNEFVQAAWQGKHYLANPSHNLKKYYWQDNRNHVQNQTGIVFSDEYHLKSDANPQYYINAIFKAARKVGLHLDKPSLQP